MARGIGMLVPEFLFFQIFNSSLPPPPKIRNFMSLPAPGKLSMAAPMAVSSWKTLVEEPFLGSTVLAFLIIGKGIKPPEARMASFNLYPEKKKKK